MCGIAGIINATKQVPEQSHLERMVEVLRHRGPDQRGLHLESGAGLGHQRLSIIDLKTGNQPMRDASGRYTLVFNGEIYNFRELRSELEGKGRKFKTASDTEVILQAYAEKGASCVSDFRGMFAFAIWDNHKREVFLARDRVGKKPLYYAVWNQAFYFASEIKALLQVPGFPREVNPNALQSYFALTYVPGPQTAFRDVYELPPAHTLTWNGGILRLEKYWRLSFGASFPGSLEEAAEQLWQLVYKATKMRLMSDVPLGVFLSGGLDSSTVVAAMAESGAKPIKTFSIGFDSERFDELPYARQVAEHFHTDHEELIIKPDALSVLPDIVWHYDQPYADASAIPTYYVSKIAKERVTVVLNGDGGDESFGGYERFLSLLKWERMLKMPLAVRSLIAGMLSRHPERRYEDPRVFRRCRTADGLRAESMDAIYLRYMVQYSSDERNHLLTEPFRRPRNDEAEKYLRDALKNANGGTALARMMQAEIETSLPGDLLVKMDRATMAHGLEARSPFLDHQVIEFAAALPDAYKIHGKILKVVVKKMMQGRLPKSILDRPKQGFGVPVQNWLSGDLAEWVRDVLWDPVTLKRPYFNPEAVRQVMRLHDAGWSAYKHKVWSLLMFELWHRTFIDRVPHGPWRGAAE